MAPTRSLAPRMTDYWWTVYKRTWKGSVVSSFVTPLLYVLAMGVLLGGFIQGDPDRLEGATTYLAFVVPGMLAAQSMQLVFGELTYPVMSGVKWHRTYFAMTASPLAVADIVAAHLLFVTFRVALSCGVFLLVLEPFGVFASWWLALPAWPVTVLVGLSFAGLLHAYSSTIRSEEGFSVVYRLLVVPMFLFSATFFPVTAFDGALRWFVEVTPLYRGVALVRELTTGTLSTGSLWSVAYLLLMGSVGLAVASRRFDRLLLK